MSRIAHIRSAHDIRVWIENDLGPPHRQGRQPVWSCPFHEERTPSFVITPDQQHFKCHGAGCGKSGDIIDYVMARNNCDIHKAMDTIENKATLLPPPPVGRKPQPDQPKKDFMKIALEHHERLSEVLPYLAERDISEETARKFLYGCVYLRRPAYLPFLDEPVWVDVKFVSIPMMSNGECHAIGYRRDDLWAEAEFKNSTKIVALRNQWYEWWEKGGGDAKELPCRTITIDSFFQRYSNERGGRQDTIYNADVLAQNGSKLAFVLIVENRFAAAAFTQLGLPVIAIKEERSVLIELHTRLNGVVWPIWLADHDENGAGMEYARRQQELIGRGRIYLPPEPYKDPDDVLRYGGEQKFMQWMRTIGIPA